MTIVILEWIPFNRLKSCSFVIHFKTSYEKSKAVTNAKRLVLFNDRYIILQGKKEEAKKLTKCSSYDDFEVRATSAHNAPLNAFDFNCYCSFSCPFIWPFKIMFFFFRMVCGVFSADLCKMQICKCI